MPDALIATVYNFGPSIKQVMRRCWLGGSTSTPPKPPWSLRVSTTASTTPPTKHSTSPLMVPFLLTPLRVELIVNCVYTIYWYTQQRKKHKGYHCLQTQKNTVWFLNQFLAMIHIFDLLCQLPPNLQEDSEIAWLTGK